MDLALYDHRIDPGAAVIQGIKAAHPGGARVPVYVHHAHIGARGIGKIGRVIIVHGFQPRFHAFRHIIVGRPGDLFHGLDRAGDALDLEAVDVPFQIGLAHLQQMGGNPAGLGPYFTGRHGDGRARHGR